VVAWGYEVTEVLTCAAGSVGTHECVALEREGNASAARRALDDAHVGTVARVILGFLEHVLHSPVFAGPRRVHRFHLNRVRKDGQKCDANTP